MSELLPCPFCGAQETSNSDGVYYTKKTPTHKIVCCGYCGARGGIRDKSDDAKMVWNTRTPDTSAKVDADSIKSTCDKYLCINYDNELLVATVRKAMWKANYDCRGETYANSHDEEVRPYGVSPRYMSQEIVNAISALSTESLPRQASRSDTSAVELVRELKLALEQLRDDIWDDGISDDAITKAQQWLEKQGA